MMPGRLRITITNTKTCVYCQTVDLSLFTGFSLVCYKPQELNQSMDRSNGPMPSPTLIMML